MALGLRETIALDKETAFECTHQENCRSVLSLWALASSLLLNSPAEVTCVVFGPSWLLCEGFVWHTWLNSTSPLRCLLKKRSTYTKFVECLRKYDQNVCLWLLQSAASFQIAKNMSQKHCMHRSTWRKVCHSCVSGKSAHVKWRQWRSGPRAVLTA